MSWSSARSDVRIGQGSGTKRASGKGSCRINATIIATQPRRNTLTFSSDLELPHETLIDYYSLRFQLEFNFRDAKQFGGLEDFMNIKPTAVTNAANLSLFMVNLTARLRRDCAQDQCAQDPCAQDQHDFSVLDLKAHVRGLTYVEEVIKLLPQLPEPIVLENLRQHVASMGAIHPNQLQTLHDNQPSKQHLNEAA